MPLYALEEVSERKDISSPNYIERLAMEEYPNCGDVPSYVLIVRSFSLLPQVEWCGSGLA